MSGVGKQPNRYCSTYLPHDSRLNATKLVRCRAWIPAGRRFPELQHTSEPHTPISSACAVEAIEYAPYPMPRYLDQVRMSE